MEKQTSGCECGAITYVLCKAKGQYRVTIREKEEKQRLLNASAIRDEADEEETREPLFRI